MQINRPQISSQFGTWRHASHTYELNVQTGLELTTIGTDKLRMRFQLHPKAVVILLGFSLLLSSCAKGSKANTSSSAEITIVASNLGSSDGSVDLAWLESPATNGTFSIFRKLTSETNFKKIGNTSENSFVDRHTQVGLEYSYLVVRTEQEDLANAISNERNTKSIYTDQCLDKSRVRALKNLSTTADAQALIGQLFSECQSSIRKLYGQDLTTEEAAIIFSGLASHLLVPYRGSVATTLLDLLAESGLDCNNYALLTGHFYELLMGSNYTAKIVMVGWDNGAMGNHAQTLFVGARSILIDPTVGIVAFTTYDEILNGVPVPSSKLFSMYGYWHDQQQPESLSEFHWQVYKALLLGENRPKDFLYYLVRPYGFN